MTTNILKKLTLSTMGHTKKTIKLALEPQVTAHEAEIAKAKADKDDTALLRLEASTLRVDLAKIVGQTTAAIPGQSAMGDYTKLAGNFMCINQQTGEISQSSICIMPNFISEPIAAALRESSQVEFAVMIYAKHSEKSAVGYEFGVQSLMDTKPTESMARLLSLAGVEHTQPKLTDASLNEAPAVDAPAGTAAKEAVSDQVEETSTAGAPVGTPATANPPAVTSAAAKRGTKATA